MAIFFLVVGCGGSDSNAGTSASASGAGESSSEKGGGGSSPETEEPAPVPSKAAFLKKADAICEASREKIVNQSLPTLRKTLSAGGNRREVEATLLSNLVIPTLEAEVEELRALGAPKGDQAKVNAILAATQEVIDEAKTEPETFLAGSQYREGHYDKARKIADEYGLTACPQT